MSIEQQTVDLTMLADAAAHTHPWTIELEGSLAALSNVRDLADILLQQKASASFPEHDGHGCPSRTRLFSIVADAGSGKTWLVKQTLFHLLNKCAAGDPEGAVPWCISIPSLAFAMASKGHEGEQLLAECGGDLVEWYAAVQLARKPAARGLILDAYRSQRLIVIFDGLDEAPSLRAHIRGFICGPLLLTGTRVVVTSRPEGIDAGTFRLYGFVQFGLKPYTNDQQQEVLRRQLVDSGERSPGRFMKHLLDYIAAKDEFN